MAGAPTRDVWVDLRGKYKACDSDRACEVIPVPERVRTDFLWQRSPFLLYGGGSGRIESPGIDFILPYWMARHYGMDFAPTVASAASGTAAIAPDSLASLFGAGMPASNAHVSVTDSAGTTRAASVFFSNSEQINFAVPPGLAMGPARVAVRDAAGYLRAHRARHCNELRQPCSRPTAQVAAQSQRSPSESNAMARR
jgi:hypothetical protein